MGVLEDRQRQQHQERRDRALAVWQRWSPLAHLANYGYGLPAADRVREALDAKREWAAVSNLPPVSGETESLAVRVAADSFAASILAAAPEAADADTIAWVVAGLRCPSQPFCTGCTACQTVTSPLRPTAEPRRGAFR